MVRKKRQHRGGYHFVGILELARELRKKQTPAETLLWQLLRCAVNIYTKRDRSL